VVKPEQTPHANTGSSSLDGGMGWAIDYRALRERVTIVDVLQLLAWKPVSRQGAQLRGPCPVHRSERPTSRSFSVNTERQVFRCFKPGCASGNLLDLYAAVTRLPLYQAALELCERLAIEPPRVPGSDT
jgi:DNA primase